jgi:hypothetical protein
MAEREINLKMTAKEERALSRLLTGICRAGTIRQFVIDDADELAIGRINAALNNLT